MKKLFIILFLFVVGSIYGQLVKQKYVEYLSDSLQAKLLKAANFSDVPNKPLARIHLEVYSTTELDSIHGTFLEWTDTTSSIPTKAFITLYHYTKAQTLTLLGAKRDTSTSYSRDQLNAGQLDTRYYTETEVNTIAGAKRDTATSYNRVYLDGAIGIKSDTTHNHALNNLSEKSYNSLTDTPNIPDSLTELLSDTGHRTVSDVEKSTWNNKTDTTDVNGLISDSLSNYLPTSGLLDSLNAKSDTGHVHIVSNITGLQDSLNKKLNVADSTIYLTPADGKGLISDSIAALNLGTIATNDSINYTTEIYNKPDIPDSVSDLTNDLGFIDISVVTSAQVGNTIAQWNANKIMSFDIDTTGIKNNYRPYFDSTANAIKFIGGTGAVGNADSLGGVPANQYLLKSDSTTYLTSSDAKSLISDSIATITIPDSLKDLASDSLYRTVTDSAIAVWNAKQAAIGYTPANNDSTYTKHDADSLLALKQNSLGFTAANNDSVYTKHDSDSLYVRDTITVNGHALTGDVTITANDVGLGTDDAAVFNSLKIHTNGSLIDSAKVDTDTLKYWVGGVPYKSYKNTPTAAMVYPDAGVPNSTGSAWGTSYTVGTNPNNLLQLSVAGKIPAVDGSQLINLPTPIIYKSAYESVTNSETLQDDNDIKFSIGVNERWVFRIFLNIVSDSTGGIRLKITYPAAATLYALAIGPTTSTTSIDIKLLSSGTEATGYCSFISGGTMVTIEGMIFNYSNPGTFQLQWAQSVSNTVPVYVNAGSYLMKYKVN